MISLIVAGDVCMRGQETEMDAARARRALSNALPVLSRADARIVNWENPTTQGETEGAPIAKSGAMLHSAPGNIAFLREGGFDLAVLANNHVGDYGPEGAKATMKHLREAGIAYVGAGETVADARKPAFIRKNGETLAVFAACEYEFGIAGKNSAGAAGYDAREMRSAIAEAKKQADYVLVVFHGGNEHNPLPSPNCVSRYRDIIDMGADALVGMHSHCPQGFEVYKGAPIIYGTGNFLFKSFSQTREDTSWHYGYLASLQFDKKNGVRFEPIPYRFDLNAERVRIMRGDEARDMHKYLENISERFQDPVEHEKWFMGWCTIAAPNYARAMRYDDAYAVHPEDPALLSARNLFCCQAHNELLTVYLRMLAEGTLKEDEARADAIREMQKMPKSAIEEETR